MTLRSEPLAGAIPRHHPPTAVEPDYLLPTVSVVEQSMGGARRAVVAMLVMSLFMLMMVTAERWWFATGHQQAAKRYAQALQLAGELKVLDQQMSHAAQMAVVSGDGAWVERYDALRPVFDERMAQAKPLAPASAVERFDAETRAAGLELDDMHESAFEAVSVNESATARAIFEGSRYREKTAQLQRATALFSSSAVIATQAQFEWLRHRHTLLGSLMLLGGAVFGLLVWRRMTRSRTEFLAAEERVRQLASSDLLTGLPNRAALHDDMAREMARASRVGGRLSLLLIDLDRFKAINDRRGDRFGDSVLREVAQRLKGVLRAGEVHARFGGDQFVVLTRDDGPEPAAHVLAARITQALSQPLYLPGPPVQLGATIGIARFPDDAQQADELLRKADAALNRAKSEQRGATSYYDRQTDEKLAERDALELAFREGLARGDVVAHCQPIVELSSGQIRGVELLARWRHPQRGWVSPVEFVPLAERCGLADALTQAVLDSGCRGLALLPPHWRMSVNLGAEQLLDDGTVERLLRVLQSHGVAPRRLDVEVTESALVVDTDKARRHMAEMKRVGFTVSLDDFGTGYSSLAYLAEMPFDRIKIDRAFVAALRKQGTGAEVVSAILGLSQSLGVPVVAEGVETEEDAQLLRGLGCQLAQGWHFGRPEAAQTWAERLRESSPAAVTEPDPVTATATAPVELPA
jgi:diguanylate cyclase (GGDEF)-like protein